MNMQILAACSIDDFNVSDCTYTAPPTYTFADDSEILFYFNCNSATTGQSPTKGSGTVAITSGISAVAGPVGNALAIGGNYRSISFPPSGNFNPALGTIGLYINYTTNVANGIILDYDANGDTSPRWYLGGTGTGTDFTLGYKSGWTTVGLSAALHFLEFAWDGTLNKFSWRLDGATWTEDTGLTGGNPSITDVCVGCDREGYLTGLTVDQIIVSSIYQKDLYAVRSTTS